MAAYNRDLDIAIRVPGTTYTVAATGEGDNGFANYPKYQQYARTHPTGATVDGPDIPTG